MESIPYRASLQEGTRVLFVYDKHPQHQKTATVVNVLPNPSRMPAHQWYDVRFDNGAWGRFLARHLESIPASEAPSATQSSVA
jgi:hypothetical protein